MIRTIEELEALLMGDLIAPIKKVDGFDYVSWSDTVRILNAIFGPLGWSDRTVSVQKTEFGYACVAELTLHLEDGTTRVHSGVGYGGVRRVDKYGKELSPVQAARAEDQGIKTAASDAISRMVKRWKALGLGLYGGEDFTIETNDASEETEQNNTKGETKEETKGTDINNYATPPLLKGPITDTQKQKVKELYPQMKDEAINNLSADKAQKMVAAKLKGSNNND